MPERGHLALRRSDRLLNYIRNLEIRDASSRFCFVDCCGRLWSGRDSNLRDKRLIYRTSDQAILTRYLRMYPSTFPPETNVL